MQRLVTAIAFGLSIGALRAEPVAEKKPPFAADKIPGGLVIAARPELAGVTKASVERCACSFFPGKDTA